MFLNTVHPSMSSGDSGSEQRPNKTELGNKELCQGNYVPARTRKGVFLLLHEQTSSESMNANLQDPRHMANLQAGRGSCPPPTLLPLRGIVFTICF